MAYKYDWTSDRLPLWLPHMQDLIGKPDTTALEIGCFEGSSTVWMLQNILTHPTSRIVVLDPFVPNPGLATDGELATDDYFPRFVENTSTYRKRIRVLQAYSREVSADFLMETERGYDLIYIDASHYADETLDETKLAMRIARRGAYIVYDDWGGTMRDVVNEYMKRHYQAGNVRVVNEAYQLIIKVER